MHVVPGVESVRALALGAIDAGHSIADEVAALAQGEAVDIAALLEAGAIGSPIVHEDPAHVIMTGTGLTHPGSAEGRDKMHRAAAEAATQTDSMRMFREGGEGGKPAEGQAGQQREWFCKGDGGQMVAPGSDFTMPHFARDGGEEPELLVGTPPDHIEGTSRIVRNGEAIWESRSRRARRTCRTA